MYFELYFELYFEMYLYLKLISLPLYLYHILFGSFNVFYLFVRMVFLRYIGLLEAKNFV